jgi:hypothetical protein
MKAPNCSQYGEIQRLTKKFDQHEVSILSNSVSDFDSQCAYQVYHLSSIGYSLGTTYITEAACHRIQGRAVSAFLATSGFNWNSPQAIVFAPCHHGGLGFVYFYLLQRQKAYVCSYVISSTQRNWDDAYE